MSSFDILKVSDVLVIDAKVESFPFHFYDGVNIQRVLIFLRETWDFYRTKTTLVATLKVKVIGKICSAIRTYRAF